MKVIRNIILIIHIFLLASCSGSHVINSWKSGSSARVYNKIMVVGLIKDTSIRLRQQIETHFVNDLKSIGYNAVSALEEFGAGGLSRLEQEETYVELCNKGIDAVITIALLDRTQQKTLLPKKVKYYSSLYYYNRIWNYNKIEADLNSIENDGQLLWESIVFDLQLLSPIYTVQTKPFNTLSLKSTTQAYEKMIVSNMLKKKVLKRQVNSTRVF